MKPAGGLARLEGDTSWARATMRAVFAALLADDDVQGGDSLSAAQPALEALSVSAVIVDETNISVSNEAWRRTFHGEQPRWVKQALSFATSVGDLITLPRAAIVPAFGARRPAAVIVCRPGEGRAPISMRSAGGSIGALDRIALCNESLAEYAGVKPGAGLSALIHEDDVELWRIAVAEAGEHVISTATHLRLRSVSGQYRYHVVKFLMLSRSERWLMLAADCHDEQVAERDRRTLQERLRDAAAAASEAHRIKDHVIAIVSHELRAPVMTMLLWERVLRESQTEPHVRAQALDAIHQSATLQSRIVGDLLDMSRAVSGKLVVELRPLDIGKIVAESVEAALPVAKSSGVTLTHEGTSDAGTVLADAGRMRQTFDNLIANALKFTPAGGQVLVSVVRRNRVLTVRIADTGCGIEPDMLPRIFDPFNQAGDWTTRRRGGLGLGLAIAKEIVLLHDGTLTATSEGTDRGTTMTVVLPTTGRRRASTGETSSQAERLRDTRVLLIDDDERARNALAFLLQRTGAVVVQADCATAAREQLSREHPDVLICDIVMPEEDGYSLLRSLRASGVDVPAIALTAFASRADAEAAVAAGFDLHVAKPIDFERLVSSVSQVLVSRQRAR